MPAPPTFRPSLPFPRNLGYRYGFNEVSHMSCTPKFLLLFFALLAQGFAATFGTVTPLTGGVVDIVLDVPRQRLYLVGVPDKIEVYSIPQRRFLAPIRTDSFPLAAALSRDGKFLYVACHNSSSINIIDPDQLAITGRVSLPAKPEGIAVGGDGRVLITTIGTGVNNSQNTLLLFDPSISDSRSLTALTLAPPTPASPGNPPTGQLLQANRSFLAASSDGRYIIGVNLPNTTTRAVFVYEVESATVLRSRTVNNISSVLSVSSDGTRFMAGLNLFETETLSILGQQNLANAPYPIAANVNFNTQQNQGGSTFSPDGNAIYSAFNIAPTQNPAARANVGQLQISDPDNLLIQMGLQMPENLAGKMLISPDGQNIFAISESGFVTIPIGQLSRSPIAVPERAAILLANDQCGITVEQRRSAIIIRNEGAGRLTANAQILTATTGAGAVGGFGGPGGGQVVLVPGGGGAIGGVVIGGPGGIQIGFPIGQVGNPANNVAVVNTSPTVSNSLTPEGPMVSFGYNSTNRSLGSTAPTNFLIQSPEAVNIPAQVRVYQNNRDAEARGDVLPVDQGISAGEALVDMAYDATRRRVYIANSGLNRIEIYDERTRKMLAPIKVGQLPRSIALSSDGSVLYVANSSSEYISMIDPDLQRVTGRLTYPPVPVATNVALTYPSVIAATQRGLLVVMSNGALWTSVGNQLIPRNNWNILGANPLRTPRTIAATPNGEYVIMMDGFGAAYLYDALADDIVQSRTIFTGAALNGYYGPITAGPRGAYYVVNGSVLNQSLTVISSNASSGNTTMVPAVTAVGNNQYARFTMPVRANATAVVTDLPSVEIVNTDTGQTIRKLSALEGPTATVVGNGRTNTDGRTMVVDATGTIAYVISTSGLSAVSLAAVSPADRPVLSQGGTVSSTSYTTDLPAGGIVSIFGRNLGTTSVASTSPLPTLLEGVCVTLSNTPLPLFSTSAGQINVQIPYTQAAGTYQLVVRDTNKKLASQTQNIRVVKYAPAVIVDPATGQAAIYDDKGRPVTKDNPTTRDRRLVIYATGLGPTKGGKVTTGAPAPVNPPAENIDAVKVFFGDKRYSQAEVVVEWSGLVPGFVGLYQINVYVPGDHLRGDNLDVTLRVSNIENKYIPAVKPTVAVD